MKSPWRRAGIACALLFVSAEVRAQAPVGPPPPSGGASRPGIDVHELLPDLGRIGSQAGAFGGVAFTPYDTGTGFSVGGYVDLPLARVPGGKLSYELRIVFSQATSDPFVATNPIAYVANLAAGASPAAALAGPPQAPFPVKRDVALSLRLLEICPFSLKWTLGGATARLRPFLTVGGDFLVVLTRVDPLRDESQAFTGTSPFDDPLIAGLVAQAPELTARGVPTGQGNLELGGHVGGGVELRVSRGVSVHFDYRFTQIGKNAHLQTVNGGIGIHW